MLGEMELVSFRTLREMALAHGVTHSSHSANKDFTASAECGNEQARKHRASARPTKSSPSHGTILAPDGMENNS